MILRGMCFLHLPPKDEAGLWNLEILSSSSVLSCAPSAFETLPGHTQHLFFLPWLLCKRNLAKQVVLISVPETHIPSCTTILFPIIPTATPLFIIFLRKLLV